MSTPRPILRLLVVATLLALVSTACRASAEVTIVAHQEPGFDFDAPTVEPVEPSPEAWQRIEAALDVEDELDPTDAPPAFERNRLPQSQRKIWPAWITAGAAALVALASAALYLQTKQTAAALRTDLASESRQSERLTIQLAELQEDRATLSADLVETQEKLVEQTEELALTRRQRDEARAAADVARQQLAETRSLLAAAEDRAEALALLDDPATRLAGIGGTEAAAAISGRAALNLEEGRVRVALRDLPALPEDRDFQLWLLTENEPPASLAVFDAEDGVAEVAAALPAVASAVTAVAVSVEPTGGSESPTGDIVAVGPVAAEADK